MAKKILIVEDEVDLLDIFEGIAEDASSDVEILTASSGNKGKKVLEEQGPVDLIMCDYNMSDGNGGVVYEYSKENGDPPFLLISGGFIDDYPEFENFLNESKNHYVFKPFDEDDLIELIKKSLIYEKSTESELMTEYMRISSQNITNFREFVPDVYLKINDEKYIRAMDINDKNSQEQLSHILEKQDGPFYIQKGEFKEFLNSVWATLESKSIKTEFDYYEFNALGYNLSRTYLKMFGISNTLLENCNSVIDKIIKKQFQTSQMKDIFNAFINRKKYLPDHTLLTLMLGVKALRELTWDNGSTVEQFSLACLLHDINFENYGDAKYSKLSDILQIQDDKIKKEVLEHPAQNAKMILDLDEQANEARNIILEHHEMPAGDGFPRGLSSSNIKPLSCVFIISHFCVDYLLAHPYKMDDLKVKLKENFSSGNFKKPLSIFLELF